MEDIKMKVISKQLNGTSNTAEVNFENGDVTFESEEGQLKITADQVDSETSTIGQVLTSNGLGGASWENFSGGGKLYRHHFDIVLKHVDLASIPDGAEVRINVNALSNSATPWATLSELDGGGFIVAAFGTITSPVVVTSYVFELKIFYSSLNTLLIDIHDLTDGTVKCAALTTVNGGSPNTFALQDSVTPIN